MSQATTLPVSERRTVTRALLAALVVLPWLQPFAPGPSPNTVPWLVGAACAVAIWSLAVWRGATVPLVPALACLLVTAYAGGPQYPPSSEPIALGAALLLMLLCAASARHLRTGWILGLLCAAALSAIAGLAQAFGLSAPLWPWISGSRIGEAYANLRQPNQFGTLCWLGIAVLVWGRPRLATALTWSLAALLGLAAAASASRTAVAHALLIGLLVLAWPGPGRQRALRTWAVAVTAFAGGGVLLPPVLQALTGVAPARSLVSRLAEGLPACSSRRVLWDNVLTLIADKPWTGWGWGELDFAHFWTLYSGPRFCEILDNAHNLPLHLAVELGLPAALALLIAAAVWVARRRPWAARAADHRLAWAILLLIGLHSLLEYPLWYAPFQMAAGLALGLLGRPSVQRATAPARHLGLALAGMLALVLAWVAWDYARVSQAYLPPDQRWASMRQDPADKMADHWLFSRQARFAQLWGAVPSPDNAATLLALSMQLLHYSPEPHVIEQAERSAGLAGHPEQVQALEMRYRIAFPERWALWKARQAPQR